MGADEDDHLARLMGDWANMRLQTTGSVILTSIGFWCSNCPMLRGFYLRIRYSGKHVLVYCMLHGTDV